MENTSSTSVIANNNSNKTGMKTIDKIADIPVVNSCLNNVTGYYDQIKETNLLLRTSCNLAELSFKTMKFASTPITHLCKKPIESVDHYLSDKVEMIENTYPVIKQPTDQITSAAFSQAKDIYDKTNTMITKPKETLYNFKDLTVSTAATCGGKVLETCLENKYTKMVTNPVLDYTEKSLNYYLPESSMYKEDDQGTVRRIFNINKRVYNHVYDSTFMQLSKLHAHFERTLEKMQSLKNLINEIYSQKKSQFLQIASEYTLVQKCQNYMEKNNLSLARLEELSKNYYKAILADVNDTVEKYMNLVKNFPAYLNGTQFKTTIEYLKNQLNKETFSIYLSMAVDYLKQLNQSLVSYTNQMFQVVSKSKSSISNMYLQSLKSRLSKEKTQQTTQTNDYNISSTSDIATHSTNTTPKITKESSTQIIQNKGHNSSFNQETTTNNKDNDSIENDDDNQSVDDDDDQSYETSTDDKNQSECISEDHSFNRLNTSPVSSN